MYYLTGVTSNIQGPSLVFEPSKDVASLKVSQLRNPDVRQGRVFCHKRFLDNGLGTSALVACPPKGSPLYQ
jgi:hypothetical protein